MGAAAGVNKLILHYPHDLDRLLNEAAADKIRQYHTDYNNRPSHPISFMSSIVSTSGWTHSEFVCLLFLQVPRENDRFLSASGVQLAQSHFHWCRTGVLFTTQEQGRSYPGQGYSTTDYVECRWNTYSF